MWIILEPVIFALIGTEIQINKIDPTTIGYGTVVLVGALIIRFLSVTPSLRPSYQLFTMNSLLSRQQKVFAADLNSTKHTEPQLMVSCVDRELALQVAGMIMIRPIYWQDGRHLLRSIVWDSQHQGENIHGLCLDAQGDCPGRPRPSVPGQLHQVREGRLEGDGRRDPHPGRPLHPDHGPAGRCLYPGPGSPPAGQHPATRPCRQEPRDPAQPRSGDLPRDLISRTGTEL